VLFSPPHAANTTMPRKTKQSRDRKGAGACPGAGACLNEEFNLHSNVPHDAKLELCATSSFGPS